MAGSCACAEPGREHKPCACRRSPPRSGAAAVRRPPVRDVERPSHTIDSVAAPSVAAALASPGQPLDAVLRAKFESRFGTSLRDVRVHADSGAARSAVAVGARAYTVANHVVFAGGAYSPGTDDGRRLIAHELVHVLQQRPGVAPSGAALRIDDSGEAAAVREAEAPSRSITRSLVRRAPAVQRQPAPAAPSATAAQPLDKTQERDAINYYFSGPHHYTPEIMRQIQNRLGVPATGVADSATVQAVAAYQQTQSAGPAPLLVDGKASSRTLARLFPSGLEAPGEAQAYGQEVQSGVIDKWKDLEPAQRAQALVDLVNPHLTKAGVPPVGVSTKPPRQGAKGEFSAEEWAIEVDPETLKMPPPSRDKAADIANTFYHEARHAEQKFKVAQTRSVAQRRADTPAEDDRLATAISTELNIRLDIVKQAVKSDKSLSKMDALIAEDWYQDFGPRNAEYGAVMMKTVAAKNACIAAQKANAANPTPQNKAALDQASASWVAARNDYYQVASENDAFTAAQGTAAGITKGGPGAPTGPDPADPCGTPVHP